MSGKFTLITGVVQSGKTELMLKLVEAAGDNTGLYQPAIDTRSGQAGLISLHDGRQEQCLVGIPGAEADEMDAIGIDEVQFYGPELVDRIRDLLEQGVDVVCCGLMADYQGVVWRMYDELTALVTERPDHTSRRVGVFIRCGVCGEHYATFSHRTVEGDERVLIGGADEYKPMCWQCHLDA